MKILGLTFPSITYRGAPRLEPSILDVLPSSEDIEIKDDPFDINPEMYDYIACSVYTTGFAEYLQWKQTFKDYLHKVIVGGYHPTLVPDDFQEEFKVVVGPCDNLLETIQQPNHVVQGILSFQNIPKYELYNIDQNLQIAPDLNFGDKVCSIATSYGCHYRCDFCCTHKMSPKLIKQPLLFVANKLKHQNQVYGDPDFFFIRDENFLLLDDFHLRLNLINKIHNSPRIYLFASSTTITEEVCQILKENNVYMVCLGLEDPTKHYSKNRKLKDAVSLLKSYGIYVYLSFIVDPLKMIDAKFSEYFYSKLLGIFFELKPEMVCGNFLMPFPGTKIWDQYKQHIKNIPDIYKYYDTKTPFLVFDYVDEETIERIKFDMFWVQWLYFTSEIYNRQVRHFFCGDSLSTRFEELYNQFKSFETKFAWRSHVRL